MVRRRGAPLDLIVSEAMILANSTWGGWLAELGVPAIYRSQASLAPGIKLRLEHLAVAPLHRSREPVADHRRRAPWPHSGSGRALQAERRGAVLGDLGLRRSVHGLQRPSGGHGTVLDAEVPAAARHGGARGYSLQGRPGARRRPAAGAARPGRRGPAARRQ